jgi:ribonuclease HII
MSEGAGNDAAAVQGSAFLESLRGASIVALRARLETLPDDDSLRAACARLADDPRAGARALAERALRRLEREAVERARIARLFERRAELIRRGARYVAGVDEVGVGPLAGPVVAAAVVLPATVDLPGLNDSKKLSRVARERLAEAIHQQAVALSVAGVSAPEIDRTNILRASLEAMRRAVLKLSAQLEVDHLLVDARIVPGVRMPQTPLTHGDAIDASIAAASIVAKVHRDALMAELDHAHPGYGFARHMGYGTAEHLEALRQRGATPAHRRSFAPVASVVSLGGA